MGLKLKLTLKDTPSGWETFCGKVSFRRKQYSTRYNNIYKIYFNSMKINANIHNMKATERNNNDAK